MAQDPRKALDEKTKKLGSAGSSIKEGDEHAAYQESQQHLSAIQAERKQNLAVARAESKASFENNQTLAQAAEIGAISAAEAEEAAQAGVPMTVNPATQAVLSKYGMGQPRVQRSSSHSQQVTKQNITINNNTTVNTTNDVKVPAGIGGPLQGRPLAFKTPSPSEGSAGRFKNWISAAFARQNEEGAKRDREYRRRESDLARSANRMMKKLEDIGKTIGSRMDPRKIGSTWQSQLKTLLMLFGFGYLASNWTKILTTVADIETWIKDTWKYFTDSSRGETPFIASIKSLLGAKEGESIGDALRELLIGDDGLWGLMKNYFKEVVDDRKKAMGMIKFPEINLNDLISTVKGIGSYVGDLLMAMISGSDGVKSHIERSIETTANKGAFEQADKDKATRKTITVTTQSGKEIDADTGIGAIINESYKGLTRYSLDSDGNLTGSKYGAESTVAQASDIGRLFLQANNGEKIDSTQMSAGLSRLYKAAQDSQTKGEGGIPVRTKFLKQWFTDAEIQELVKSGDAVNKQYYVVARKKTGDDMRLEDADITARFAKEYAEKKVGDIARKVTGNEDTVLGNLYGGYQIAKGTVNVAGAAINKMSANDYRIEYVRQPREGDEIISDKNGKPSKSYFIEISPKVVQKITDKITGKENTNIDIKDRNFVTSVQSGMVESAKNAIEEETKIRENYRKGHLTDYQNNSRLIFLRNRRAELSSTEKNIDLDLDQAYNEMDNLAQEEQDRNVRLQQAYENSRVKPIGDKISAGISTVKNFASQFIPSKLAGTNKTQDQKAMYTIRRLMGEGLTREQAAGIAGNIMKESGFNPKAGTTDNNLQYAGGIVGWNGANYEAAKKYFGKDLKKVSYEDQLEYLIKEMKGEAGVIRIQERDGFAKRKGFKTGDNVMDLMKKTTSVADSTNTFERVFEGSGDYKGYWERRGGQKKWVNGDQNAKRIGFATTFYKKSGGTADAGVITTADVGGGQKKAIISLIGDSYAVGMASTFVKEIEKHNAIGKASVGKDTKDKTAYCVSGARIEQCESFARAAVGDGASVIVIHAGLNNCTEGREALYNKLSSLGQVAMSGGAKVFFIAPITTQTRSTLLQPEHHPKKLHSVILQLCSEFSGFGLIDLEPLNKKFEKMDREGIHPTNLPEMAKEVVKLLFGSGEVNYMVDQGGLPGDFGDDDSTGTRQDEPKSFMSILIDKVKNALFNFGQGFTDKSKDTLSTISDNVEKIVDSMGRKEKIEPWKGPITSEFTDYNSYKKDPGNLKPGMSEEEWIRNVSERTGSIPFDLQIKLDQGAEEKRQAKLTNSEKPAEVPAEKPNEYVDLIEKNKDLLDPRQYNTYNEYVTTLKEAGIKETDGVIKDMATFYSYRPYEKFNPSDSTLKKLYNSEEGINAGNNFAQRVQDKYGIDFNEYFKGLSEEEKSQFVKTLGTGTFINPTKNFTPTKTPKKVWGGYTASPIDQTTLPGYLSLEDIQKQSKEFLDPNNFETYSDYVEKHYDILGNTTNPLSPQDFYSYRPLQTLNPENPNYYRILRDAHQWGNGGEGFVQAVYDITGGDVTESLRALDSTGRRDLLEKMYGKEYASQYTDKEIKKMFKVDKDFKVSETERKTWGEPEPKYISEWEKSKILDPRNYLSYEDYTEKMKEAGLESKILDKDAFTSYQPHKSINLEDLGEQDKKDLFDIYTKTRGIEGRNQDEAFLQEIADKYGLKTSAEISSGLTRFGQTYANEIFGDKIEGKDQGEDFLKLSPGFELTDNHKEYIESEAYPNYVPLSDITEVLGKNASKWNNYLTKEQPEEIQVPLRPTEVPSVEKIVTPEDIEVSPKETKSEILTKPEPEGKPVEVVENPELTANANPEESIFHKMMFSPEELTEQTKVTEVDILKEIRDLLSGIDSNTGRNVNVSAALGKIMAQNVDATRQGSAAQANAVANLAKMNSSGRREIASVPSMTKVSSIDNSGVKNRPLST
ncbi:MAG: hypothetical protein J6I84_04895 [Bacilli bacterium]|nr:hypothetical protein [Bacilli bacterium]